MATETKRPTSSLSWQDVTVTTKPLLGQPKTVLCGVSGRVDAGEMIAIMGPSGCGKTTLLNHLAHRKVSSILDTSSRIMIDGLPINGRSAQEILRYVSSEDTLIGALTVRETLRFAAQMSLPQSPSREQLQTCVDDLLQAFGLYDQADTIVGTLTRQGLSTGQKRRLSVASQMAAAPRILLLDEPTSGLDSAASYTVMSYIRDVAKEHNLIVVCSIHQPSTTTFNLFDKVLLLSQGKTCYNGLVSDVKSHFDSLGHPMVTYINPAEFILDLVNVEVARDKPSAERTLAGIQEAWTTRPKQGATVIREIELTTPSRPLPDIRQQRFRPSVAMAVLSRSWLKSRRDIMVYGIRFAMYMMLAFMMGTTWLRLAPVQSNIQAYATCILFGSAFMSFMAIVYVPAFLEDRQMYVKERENGLYGSATFVLVNFIMGLPYLFAIALFTSAFVYWMVDFRPSGEGFIVWVLWMYLNLLAAESFVIFQTAVLPHFVGALAMTAMGNGLWMACNGFMVAPDVLNVFNHYVFYYINYQAYVFRGLLTNEMATRTYACNEQCYCQYDTALKDQCLIAGADVLVQQYGFEGGSQGLWIGITIGIIAVLRLFGWLALEFRR